jgi:ribonucleoside-diphosphate reductase alpha chain
MKYMYGVNELSKTIFKERYALHDEETFEEACMRLAATMSSVEDPKKIPEWKDKFYEELINCRLLPAGRIWNSAGKAKATMLNCFGLVVGDSREAWGNAIKNIICISGVGGGTGLNFSGVRCRGAKIRGTGGVSSGAVSLMRMMNGVAREISDGGGRRSAQIAILDIKHPDLLEFLDAKLKDGDLDMFNISVSFESMSAEEFFDLVRNDEEYHLEWSNEVSIAVKAKDVFERIVDNFLERSEPGMVNLDYCNETNSLKYISPISTLNPCGESTLPAYGCCVLSSLVLPNFYNQKTNDVNWKQLDKTIRRSVRFLDNVIDTCNYPISETEEEAKSSRRIGLGVTGFADLLALKGLKYGSQESLDFTAKLFRFIRDKSYDTSTYIASEKGSFPKFDKEQYLSSGFAKMLKKSLKGRIDEYGLRNCAVNSIAPTGTISLLVGCSSGIEPVFGPAYYIKRWSKNGKDYDIKEDMVFNTVFDNLMQEGKDVSHFCSMYDIEVEDHFKVQSVIQQHVDQAISKTISIPNLKQNTKKEFKNLLMQYFPKLKGVTVYVLGSKKDQPITPMNLQEAIKLWHEHKDRETESRSLDSCKDGKCDL